MRLLPRSGFERPPTQAERLLADPPKRFQQAGFILLALLLLLALALQIRADWVEPYAQKPALRPWITGFCKVAFCTPPALQALDELRLMQVRIGPHPQHPQVIRVETQLVNNAPFIQPHPRLQVILSDRFGRVVGRRLYRPADYLPAAPAGGIAAGQILDLTLDLMQPDLPAFGLALAPIAPAP